MKSLLTTVMLTAICLLGHSQENTFSTKWDNGYKVESSDGNFKLKFGGRIQYDAAFFSQDQDIEDAFGELKNGVEFRRVRFFNSGTVYSNVKYKIQLSYEGGEVTFKDVYIELTDLPVGNLRVGHFKEPLRLEALTSSKYMTFMERSFSSSYAPERNTGLMFHDKALDSRLFWELAILRNGNSAGDDVGANDGVNFTARLSGLAMQDKEKKQLLHIGAAVSVRKPQSEEYSISLRPESHLAPKLAKTGTITDVDNINIIGLEAALVLNSLSIQGEYARASVKTGDVTYAFPTFYAYASYFLTGESRKYKSGYDGFDRVSPINNYGSDGGGAWEVAIRYSNGNLTDQGIGRELNDITLAVNWYLNPVARFMFNYVNADLKDVGTASIFQTRFQIDF